MYDSHILFPHFFGIFVTTCNDHITLIIDCMHDSYIAYMYRYSQLTVQMYFCSVLC